MTRLVNEQNIRTPQRIENRACNDPGILTTDMKPISCGLPSMRAMCPLDTNGQTRDLPGSGATLLHVMWPLTPAGRQHLA